MKASLFGWCEGALRSLDDDQARREPEPEPIRRGGSSRDDFMLDPFLTETENICCEFSRNGCEVPRKYSRERPSAR